MPVYTLGSFFSTILFYFFFHHVCRKIPKISPGTYIFQRPLLRGLFLEGPTFRGAYGRREICVIKSFGVACSGKEIYHFCLFYFVFEGKFQVQAPPGGLYSEGRFNGGFLAVRFWGAYIWRAYTWRGLFSEFYGNCYGPNL